MNEVDLGCRHPKALHTGVRPETRGRGRGDRLEGGAAWAC